MLSTPFDTLIAAIRREFKEERVGLPDGVKVSKTHIDAYLASISDEAGRIPVDLEAEAIHTDEAVEDSVLTSGTRPQGERVRAHGKRVSIGDLLTAGLVREGDQWRLSAKGEVVWGRLESNGQLEVNGEGHGNPSKAFQAGPVYRATGGTTGTTATPTASGKGSMRSGASIAGKSSG